MQFKLYGLILQIYMFICLTCLAGAPTSTTCTCDYGTVALWLREIVV